MPNAKTHFVVGMVVGVVVNVASQRVARPNEAAIKFDWWEMVACALAAGTAAALPDILEPADSPMHRRFFHSLAAAGIVAWLMSGNHIASLPAPARVLFKVLGFGYLSHLALDACTPRSLPVLGLKSPF